MHLYLIEMLECPVCHGKLEWSITEQNENRIETAEARCTACAAIYFIHDEIGLFLIPRQQRNDLWEKVDNGLMPYLHSHPELRNQLMNGSLNSLNPADQFFRALVLEEEGNYIEAKIVEDLAKKALYTAEYLNCWNSQMDYVIDCLSTTEKPILDIASGRCYLVERLACRLKRPIVATDFSPKVLWRDRELLKSMGLYDQVSLLAFDARNTPFKDGSIETLTTNLGFSTIEKPGSLLKELRRIVAGNFYAISHFFPEDDETNKKMINKTNLTPLLYRRKALKNFIHAGWKVEMKNACMGKAYPTPSSIVLDGAEIDNLPVANTILEWCVLLGSTVSSNVEHRNS